MKFKRNLGTCSACNTRTATHVARHGVYRDLPLCGAAGCHEGPRSSETPAPVVRKNIENASDLIVAHRMNWCRARIFHALAGAHEQGKLMEVLHELFNDDSDFADFVNDENFEGFITSALTPWKIGRKS